MTVAPIIPLQLVVAFGRALAHKIRTPLSVITNDLTYLQTRLPDGECSRSLDRGREIAELLRRVCDGSDTGLKQEECSIASLLPGSWIHSAGAASAVVDQGKMTRALDLFNDCLQSVVRGAITAQEVEGCSRPTLCVSGAVDEVVRDRIGVQEFQLVTVLLSDCLDRDLVAPPLVDALFLAQGCGITIRIVGRNLHALITFPAR